MKINNDNTFIIKGINMKGEAIMGLIMVMIILIIVILGMSLIILTNSNYSFRNPPFFSFLFLLFLGLGFALLSGKYIGKKLSWLWYIKIEEEGISILEKSRKHYILFNELDKGMCIGSPGMRFLSIKSRGKIRIRVGVGGYAPYSSENDIVVFDNLMSMLEKKLELNQFEIKKSKDNKALFGFEFRKYKLQ